MSEKVTFIQIKYISAFLHLRKNEKLFLHHGKRMGKWNLNKK